MDLLMNEYADFSSIIVVVPVVVDCRNVMLLTVTLNCQHYSSYSCNVKMEMDSRQVQCAWGRMWWCFHVHLQTMLTGIKTKNIGLYI
jgi:hypothetical protein